MALTHADNVNALIPDRALNMQGAPFEVLNAECEQDLVVLSVKPGKSRHKLPLDEGPEGARIRWRGELDQEGLIKMVDPDKERIVLQSGPRQRLCCKRPSYPLQAKPELAARLSGGITHAPVLGR